MTRRDCCERLAGGREGLPLRIDPPYQFSIFSFLIHTYAIYGSAHGQSSPIGPIGPPGMKRERRKNARKMEAERERYLDSFCAGDSFVSRLQIIFPLRTGIRYNNGVQSVANEIQVCRFATTIHPLYERSNRFDISVLDTNCDIDFTCTYSISNGKTIYNCYHFLTTAVINVYDD